MIKKIILCAVSLMGTFTYAVDFSDFDDWGQYDTSHQANTKKESKKVLPVKQKQYQNSVKPTESHTANTVPQEENIPAPANEQMKPIQEIRATKAEPEQRQQEKRPTPEKERILFYNDLLLHLAAEETENFDLNNYSFDKATFIQEANEQIAKCNKDSQDRSKWWQGIKIVSMGGFLVSSAVAVCGIWKKSTPLSVLGIVGCFGSFAGAKTSDKKTSAIQDQVDKEIEKHQKVKEMLEAYKA